MEYSVRVRTPSVTGLTATVDQCQFPGLILDLGLGTLDVRRRARSTILSEGPLIVVANKGKRRVISSREAETGKDAVS